MNYVFRPTGREPWRSLVQAAVLELDIERIPQRILIAQAAVIKEIEHGLHGDGAERFLKHSTLCANYTIWQKVEC
jgi:hypothetical protein